MSMRKTMALADRGWTDPTTYVRILSGPDGYKRVGSVFLIVAMVLNILGGIIQPLQQVLLSTRSIKTPDSQWPS